MRLSQIFIGFCILSNLYQFRYYVLQLIEICLQLLVYLFTDAHRYIQQPRYSFQDTKSCEKNNIKQNYNLSQYEYECPQHRYNIQIIERRPLIIYIENLLTENEIQHLIELA
jgi:hypothetical protein